MRAPKGFGKNYFSLSAIQAYSSHVLLGQREAQVHAYTLKLSDECDSEEDEDDSGELLCSAALNIPAHAGHPAGSALGAHCNCYFHRITRNRIRQNPRPKLFIDPYFRTNSAISPPYFPLFNSTHIKHKQGKQ